MSSKYYRLDVRFYAVELIKYLLLAAMVGILFFDSFILGILFIPVMLTYYKRDVKKEYERQKDNFTEEYRNAIVSMAGNLGAGYSMEKAFVMGLHDAARVSDGHSLLAKCIPEIENSLVCSISIEEILNDVAVKSEIEDIREFSQLLVASKRYGGNAAHMSRQYARNVSEKRRLKNELNTMIAAKKLEGRVMVFAPFIIVFYMRLTNGSYMSMLYETLAGRAVMLISLVVIFVVSLITDRLSEIEV